MNDLGFLQLRNLGVIIEDVDKEILNILQKEVDNIQQDFSKARPHNSALAGNIYHEYVIENHRETILNYIKRFAVIYEEQYRCLDLLGARAVTGSHNKKHYQVNLSLSTVWANFQKKHEFNPMHTHNGLYSFVIWLKIPYFIELEKSVGPARKTIMNKAGCFEFIYTNILGDITGELLEIDKKMEGKIAFFPARLNHQVYPFYSSDDYRISVSGNLYLDE